MASQRLYSRDGVPVFKARREVLVEGIAERTNVFFRVITWVKAAVKEKRLV
jgi:hypothetical protein